MKKTGTVMTKETKAVLTLKNGEAIEVNIIHALPKGEEENEDSPIIRGKKNHIEDYALTRIVLQEERNPTFVN